MNQILYKDSFWELFWQLEDGNIQKSEIDNQAEVLGESFKVTKEVDGDMFSWVVEFIFSCGKKYSILLKYSLDSFGSSSKSLNLKDNLAEKIYELGWWDLARWHPYCLKPEEFETLITYWKKFDSIWKDTDFPLLLLYNFVGFENEEIASQVFRQVENICDQLNINFANAQPSEFLDFFKSEDFEWILDDKLGWLFVNKEYDCYSIRNMSHIGENEEGSFPFKMYNEMVQNVSRTLNS